MWRAVRDACRAFDATLVLDVSHDLGAMGPEGTGLIGAQEMGGEVDVVVGSFAKTFCDGGGFVALPSRAAAEFLKFRASSFFFSCAMSPVQAAVVLEALRLVRGAEGRACRAALLERAEMVRDIASRRGLEVHGEPSPVVPISVGGDRVAQVSSRLLADRGIIASLVEFPAVPVGKARFRLHLMAGHELESLSRSIEVIADTVEEARRC